MDALARLCALYWYPVFAFVRSQARSADEARDITQAFFTRLLEKRELGHADRARGRFRSFLLSACSHFIANTRDHENALKRGGGTIAVPIDMIEVESRYAHALSSTETPERLYERQWALSLMDAVLESLRVEYVRNGSERVFERLKPFLIDPDESTAAAAEDLGMTVEAVRVAIHRFRKRYRKALLQRVADTVESPDQVDEEIRHLLKAVSAM
jgi:RNA polymerase sigma-70 factor (ECF subfamily)